MRDDPSVPDDSAVALRATGIGHWSFVPGSYEITLDTVTAQLIDAPGPGTFGVEELLGNVHPDDRRALFRALEDLSRQIRIDPRSAEQRQVLEEFRLRGADGGTRWLRLRGGVVRDPDGRLRVVGVTADTTGLRTSRERTGRTLAGVSEGVLILEPDWTVAYLNDSGARLLALPAAGVVGRPFWDEVPDTADSPVHVNLRWAMEHHRPVTFEAPIGTGGWTEVRVLPSNDGLTVYLRGVEDRHEAERERTGIVRRLERALTRGRQLLALTRSLSTALTVEEVADAVTAHARRSLGTVFAGIALVDASGRFLEYVSMSPLPAQTAAVWSRFPIEQPAPVSDAARLAVPFFHESVAQAVEDFPDIGAHMATAGVNALAHLPLVSASGSVLGTLALSWSGEHPMSAEERDFLVTVAGHTVQAIERATLFEEQQSVTDALQRAVLPDVMPDVAGLTLAARYVPASGQTAVGGDWYDAFVLPFGRVGIAVGDAAGHGLPAARMMSVLRNALRAYAVLGGGPASVLDRLDRLVAELEPDSFATVAYLELDPVTGEGSWASAGHLPVLRLSPDGEPAFDDTEPDPPIGAVGVEAPQRHRFRLTPGETLVLFTDGLVERRDADLDAGLERLRAAVGQARDADPGDLLDAVLDGLLGDEGSTDDVCVVVVRREATAGPVEVGAPSTGVLDTVTERLQPVPSAPFDARTAARDALREWHLDELTDTVTLIVSEVVTNAVTHAGGELVVTVERRAECVRVSVADTGSGLPEHRRPGPGEEHGRGVHLVDLLADRWGTEMLGSGKRVWAEVDLP